MDQFTDDKGRALLAEGTRVRSRQHPDLTGYVKHYEWNKPGKLSPIPYCIGWDDPHRACGVLGWLFVWTGSTRKDAEIARLRAALKAGVEIVTAVTEWGGNCGGLPQTLQDRADWWRLDVDPVLEARQ